MVLLLADFLLDCGLMAFLRSKYLPTRTRSHVASSFPHLLISLSMCHFLTLRRKKWRLVQAALPRFSSFPFNE